MIKFFNRLTHEYEVEKVYGDKSIHWAYESPIGKSITELIVKRRIFSKIFGMYNDSKLSRSKIPKFIKNYDIDLSIAEKSLEDFSSFNDFFTRKLQPNARPYDSNKNILISPGDGRILAYENIDINSLVQVKHLTYSLAELIGDKDLADKYNGGTCIILRLCPTDYHRFHFVDNGVATNSTPIKGVYYSVNPVALDKIPKLFCQNKREYSILKSENFGDVLTIEVGATGVGSIIQTYKPNTRVSKGSEKGYFKFGGSTTILFLEKNCATIDKDIIEQTNLGFECIVKMGEKIGIKSNI